MKRLALVIALLASLLIVSPTLAAKPGTTWRVAVVVYDSVDASCNGRHVGASLPPGEAHEAVARLNDSAALVASWTRGSDGTIATTRINAGMLTRVTTHGTFACFPSPDDVRAMGDWPAGFDTVYVLFENDDDAVPGEYLNGYGGLSYTSLMHGSTYVSQPVWDGGQDWFDDSEYGRHIFVHEWGNGVGQFYRDAGFAVPSLYADRSRYRFTSWYPDWPANSSRSPQGSASASPARRGDSALPRTTDRRSIPMFDLTAFLNDPAGLALKALLVAAALDFVFGVLAAIRDGSFQLIAVAAWVRKHLAGRVAPIAALLIVTYLTGDAVTLTAAAAAAAAYVAETYGSILDSIGTIRNPQDDATGMTITAATTEGDVTVRSGVGELVLDASNPVPTD